MTLADQHYHNHPNHAAFGVIVIFAASQESVLESIRINEMFVFIRGFESV